MLDLLGYLSSPESWVAGLAALLPFGYAFGAGMVASVNPCGFLMLPAFGTYYLGTEDPAFEQSPVYLRLLRAIMFGAVATLGFIALFGSIGALLALGGNSLTTLFPWGGLIIGIALTGIGVWLLSNLLPNTGLIALGLFPRRLIAIGIAVGFVELILAGLAGAVVYKEGEA